MILLHEGREAIEEGMGFGIPVIRLAGDTFFSRNAEVSILDEHDPLIIEKLFIIDGVERIKLGEHILEDSLIRLTSNLFAELYRKKRALRKPILNLQRWLGVLKVKTEILPVEPLGEIQITYSIYKERVHIRCDLKQLDKGVDRRVFILNEQGSSLFRRYEDSDDLCLVDESIGAWERVEAREACLSNLNCAIGFRLKRSEEATMWMGREIGSSDLAWAGLAYELPPNIQTFDYDIQLFDRCEERG